MSRLNGFNATTLDTLFRKADVVIAELGHEFCIGKVNNYEVSHVFAEDWRFFVVGRRKDLSGDWDFTINYCTEQKEIDKFIKKTLSNHIKDELIRLDAEYVELKKKQKEFEDKSEDYSLFFDYEYKIIDRSGVDYDKFADCSKKICELTELLKKYETKE